MMVLPSVERWFGKGGRTFPNAFDTTPLCCPSRATILTGTWAHNHGILTNEATGRDIFDENATVERYLQEIGYRTALFGKFFNFWKVEKDPSFFDQWAIFTPARDSNGYRNGLWNVQGSLRRIQRYSTDFIAERGARFIRTAERHDDQPWFLELATYAPHLTALAGPGIRGRTDPSIPPDTSDEGAKPVGQAPVPPGR